MNKHGKKLLVVGLVVLAIGFVVGLVLVGDVSADEPEPKTAVLTDGTVIEVVASPSVEGLVLAAATTSVATDEVPSCPECPEYCGDMNCARPVTSSRFLPAYEPTRWWAGCQCKNVGPPGYPNEVCVCPKQSLCGRTWPASFLGWEGSGGRRKGYGYTGWYEGAGYSTLARFWLSNFANSEVEKVTLTLEGLNVDYLGDNCSDVVFKIELLQYAPSGHIRGEWSHWPVLGTIYEVSGDYLRVFAKNREKDEVLTVGFRFLDELVPGVEETIEQAHLDPHRTWSSFVRVTPVNQPEEGNCLLGFQNALLTVIPRQP